MLGHKSVYENVTFHPTPCSNECVSKQLQQKLKHFQFKIIMLKNQYFPKLWTYIIILYPSKLVTDKFNIVTGSIAFKELKLYIQLASVINFVH